MEFSQTKEQISYRKEEDYLKKNLSSQLKQFERCKQWADIGNWIHKMDELLRTHRTPYIPEKILLAKRLAQCLNPSLPPGIHQNTLKIYRLIFENYQLISKIDKNEDAYKHFIAPKLSCFSIGLFPFFQFSSPQIKPDILKIFKEFYYTLGIELVPCLPALLVTILPGLDEPNEDMQKTILNSLDDLSKKVGDKFFFGSIWLSILRVPRIRNAGLKYLQKLLKKLQNLDQSGTDFNISQNSGDTNQLSKEIKKSIYVEENYSEQKQSNENNLQQESYQIEYSNRYVDPLLLQSKYFDFVDQHSQIKKILYEQIINEQQLNQNEIYYPNKGGLVVNSLLVSLQDPNQLVRRNALDLLISNFKINCTILSDNDKLVLVQGCLLLYEKKEHSIQRRLDSWFFSNENIMLDSKEADTEQDLNQKQQQSFQIVIDFIVKAYIQIIIDCQESLEDEDQKANPIKILKNFYFTNEQTVSETIDKVSFELIKYIKSNQKNDEIMKASLRLFESVASHMGKVCISLCKQYAFYIKQFNDNQCIEIIKLIDFTFNQYVMKMENIEIVKIIKPILEEVLPSLCVLKIQDIFKFKHSELCLRFCLDLLINFKKINLFEPILKEEISYIEIFSDYFINMSEFIESQDNISQDIFSLSSQIVLNLQKYQLFVLQIKYHEIPKWFLCLINCLYSKNPGILLIAIEGIMDIIVTENSDMKQLMKFLIEDDMKRIKLLLNNLWQMLDYHFQQSKIIDFLLIFQKEFKQIFKQQVENTLSNEDEEVIDYELRRYTCFFRMTNEFYLRNTLLNQGVGLTQMFRLLQHTNPLIRQSSKSWLTESSNYLSRILDPILDNLILTQKNAQIYITENYQLIYTANFDTSKIQMCIQQLKAITDNLGQIFIEYIYAERISGLVKQLLQQSPFKTQVDIENCSYLNIIIVLLQRFIQGQGIESLNKKFYQENQLVNANCCELLEQMLDISDFKKEIAVQLLYYSMQSALKTLRLLIVNQDQIMQVQLLNLLKVMIRLLKDSQCNYESDYFLVLNQQVSSKLFYPNLLQGLNESKIFYVRSRYVSLITIGIYMLSTFIDEQNLRDTVLMIIENYLRILQQIEVQEEEQNGGDIDTNVNSELQNQRQSLKIVIEMDQEEQQYESQFQYLDSFMSPGLIYQPPEEQIFDKNIYQTRKQIASRATQSNFTEILNVCEALKAILRFFLQFKEDKIKQEQQSSSMLMDIITLRMITKNYDIKQKIENVQFKQFGETNKMILNILPNIIRTYLHCWTLSSNFQNHKFFTNKGIIIYSYENFQNYNKNLLEQVNLLKKQQHQGVNSLKTHIQEILKPLSLQFPRDFIQALLIIWMEENENDLFDNQKQEENYNYVMLKLIELLVTLNINPVVFLLKLIETQTLTELDNFYKQKISIDRNYNYYDAIWAQRENKALFFVYTFLSYTQLDKQSVEPTNLSKFWNAALSLLGIFKNSKSPSTVNWTLEIFFLLSRKFSPKEIMSDKSLKKEVHQFVKFQLNTLAQIGSKKLLFTTSKDAKDIINVDKQKFKILSPMTPSIYELYQNCQLLSIEKSQHNIQDFLKFKSNANKGEDKDIFGYSYAIEQQIFQRSKAFEEEDRLKDKDFINRQSLIALKTIKKLSYELLQNIYDQNERIIEVVKDFVLILLPTLERRHAVNQIFVEGVSEIIYALFLKSRDHLVNDMKKHIIEYFMINDFFKCTKPTLKYWTTIIDLTSDKSDLISDLLDTQQGLGGLFTGMLTSKTSETVQRIKKLERICFLIYSGSIDKYKNKLQQLIENMMEVIKDPDSAHPAILILILFCIRILILRLSQQTLTDLFRDLWPILLTLLMQIFDKKFVKQAELVTAALKLVELISIVQIDEFYLHQWIFVFDYFGICLEPIDAKDQQNRNKVITPFQFTPLLSYHFPNLHKLDYLNKQSDDNKQITHKVKKRQFVLKEAYLETETELSCKVRDFVQYMIDINQERLSVDLQSIESVVQEDFKKLDDYIFEIKVIE